MSFKSSLNCKIKCVISRFLIGGFLSYTCDLSDITLKSTTSTLSGLNYLRAILEIFLYAYLWQIMDLIYSGK